MIIRRVYHLLYEYFDLRRHSVNPYVFAFRRGVTYRKRKEQLIVSLTSHPGRINSAHLTIRTLLNQSYKPDHIILWLAEEQFPDGEEKLPKKLLALKKNGLEIKWCKDTRSYKKLLPTLELYPDDIIITVDDDWYYRNDLVERLVNEHNRKPDCIISNRVTHPLLNEEGEVIGRLEESRLLGISSYLNKLVGSDGVLYPPHSLDKEVFSDSFVELAPTNDDIWFWAMAVKKHTEIYYPNNPIRPYSMTSTTVQQESSLNAINSVGSVYEDCLKKVLEAYPEVSNTVFLEMQESQETSFDSRTAREEAL